MRIVAELVPARREQTVELAEPSTGLDLLRALGLAPDGHILVRHDLPIPADESLTEGDRVRVVAVASGGSSP